MWPEGRDALKQILAIRQRQPDQKEWRIADARRAWRTSIAGRQ